MIKMPKFDELKKMGEEWVKGVKESGVIDRVKSNVKECVGAVSDRLTSGRSAWPLPVREKFSELETCVANIIKQKQTTDESIDPLTEKARTIFAEVIEKCQTITKIETPKIDQPEEK